MISSDIYQNCRISDLPRLLSPQALEQLEDLAAAAKAVNLLRFGKAVRLYAPLYISNECVNGCVYCGFNVNNRLERTTLKMEELLKEADELYAEGFRHLLLVSGEDRDKVPVSFLTEVSRRLSERFEAISIEVYPMAEDEYRLLGDNGVTGIALYQETYDREVYARVHKGPKADYEWRLSALDRAGRAGYRELGIGSLIGLADPRQEMLELAAHADRLGGEFWQARISVSFPRLRSSAGSFTPDFSISDRQLAQIIFAFRLVLPDADLVLSTREASAFRDGMVGIAATRLSAGSRTNPGGYTMCDDSLEQFSVADERSAAEVAKMLAEKGLEPVWKDFDKEFVRRDRS